MVNSTGIIEGSLSYPSLIRTVIMGLSVEPMIMDMSQSNRGTREHHIPYPSLRIRHKVSFVLTGIRPDCNAHLPSK